ncbi:nidogen-like [Anopheles ziemanni]|uniref:nidogen-like n=1 Tax=Anopheles coustani TaxID=139045 RepID=UPI0026582924|nr:nidogen-like [Anopheles coustani]XP_058177137.1 nidogen-like [Anopheles ziemanni]
MITHAGGISRLLTEGISIRVNDAEDPNSLDYDCVENRIYYSDYVSKQIFTAKYDGTDQRLFITYDLINPWGIAIDWIRRQLYWSDSLKGTIEVARLDYPTQRKVVITGNVNTWYIALDLQRRKLFWIDWNTPQGAKIEWANLDGSDRKLLVGRPQVLYPKGIQVIDTTGELCYTDADTGTLACIDPYSKQTRTILSGLTRPYGLTMMNERFYWINEKTYQIESSSLYGSDREFIGMNSVIYDIKAVSNTCSNN